MNWADWTMACLLAGFLAAPLCTLAHCLITSAYLANSEGVGGLDDGGTRI